ncbi:glutamate--tRNA ligase family protein [Algoriphagus namhaensis]
MSLKLTRFAPTPSGFLHLGNLYSFLVTKALANHHQSRILLRIDDLDQDRVRDEYIQDIFDSLDFMGLEYDLGPKNLSEFKETWSQLHRLPLYENGLRQLIDSNQLFACNCSRKKIKMMNSDGHYLGHCLGRGIPLGRKETALRLNTEEMDSVKWKQYSGILRESFLPEESLFPVVRKKDRVPSYHLASVMDDIQYGVDLIVRGKDLLPSTLAQMALSTPLSEGRAFQVTQFYHHDLLLGPNRKKLSKSASSESLHFLRTEGLTAAHILELLSKKLGWNTIVSTIADFEVEFLSRLERKNPNLQNQ